MNADPENEFDPIIKNFPYLFLISQKGPLNQSPGTSCNDEVNKVLSILTFLFNIFRTD